MPKKSDKDNNTGENKNKKDANIANGANPKIKEKKQNSKKVRVSVEENAGTAKAAKIHKKRDAHNTNISNYWSKIKKEEGNVANNGKKSKKDEVLEEDGSDCGDYDEYGVSNEIEKEFDQLSEELLEEYADEEEGVYLDVDEDFNKGGDDEEEVGDDEEEEEFNKPILMIDFGQILSKWTKKLGDNLIDAVVSADMESDENDAVDSSTNNNNNGNNGNNNNGNINQKNNKKSSTLLQVEPKKKNISNSSNGGAMSEFTERDKNYVKNMPPNERQILDDRIREFDEYVSNETRVPLKIRMLLSNMPIAQKQIIYHKIRSFEKMTPLDGEYSKMMKWIDGIMKIPFDMEKKLPTFTNNAAIQQFLQNTWRLMDNAIYGNDVAKQQIIQFIAQRITNPQSNGMVMALQGPPGIGKCLGYNTEILMYDGQIKKVQEVKVGDQLMGDDSQPRNVLSITSGFDELFEVRNNFGERYVVNSSHILSLKFTSDAEIYDIELTELLKLPKAVQLLLKGYKVDVEFQPKYTPITPYLYGYLWALHDRILLYEDKGYDVKMIEMMMMTHGDKYMYQLYKYFINVNIITENMDERYLYNTKIVRSEVLKGIMDYQQIYINRDNRGESIINAPVTANLSFDYTSRHRRDNRKMGDSWGWTKNNQYSFENFVTPYNIYFLNQQKKKDCIYLIRSLGFFTTSGGSGGSGGTNSTFKEYFRAWFKHYRHSYSIHIRSIGWGAYYGFEIDGNKRFLLGDFTVTHNTSLIKNGLAKSLDLPFQLIALGGCNDTSILEGHNYTYEGSTWGRIAQAMIDSKCNNPIILMDELDKIGSSRHSENVNGILTHLTDHTQNANFRDRYFTDIDIDLSKVFFIFSFNHEEEVNKILKDRMYVIRLKGFNKSEKIQIAKKYFIGEMEDMFRLKNSLVWRDNIIEWLINEYCGDEEGVRNLKRKIETVYRTMNMLRYFDGLGAGASEENTKFIEQWSRYISIPVQFPFTLTENVIRQMIEWQEHQQSRETRELLRTMFL